MVADERLRELTRRGEVAGTLADRMALLAQQLRIGASSPTRLRLEAFRGDAAARALLGVDAPPTRDAVRDEPLSTANEAFCLVVEDALDRGEELVVLVRHAAAGGAKDYFVVRRPEELAGVLGRRGPRTSISVFFAAALPVRGVAGPETERAALELLATSSSDPAPGVDALRLDMEGPPLPSTCGPEWLGTADEVRSWFLANRGAPVAVGLLRFWEDNGDRVVTAYVPDDDGVVRPGPY